MVSGIRNNNLGQTFSRAEREIKDYRRTLLVLIRHGCGHGLLYPARKGNTAAATTQYTPVVRYRLRRFHARLYLCADCRQALGPRPTCPAKRSVVTGPGPQHLVELSVFYFIALASVLSHTTCLRSSQQPLVDRLLIHYLGKSKRE